MKEQKITPNVLIVDDIPANLFTLKNTLEGLNINIIEASSGNEALSLMAQQDFALVLLDVQMPEMSGYEVAEFMRHSKRTKHIPIIFITANSREKFNELKGYDVGAVDYIPKPFDQNILISKIEVFTDLYAQKIKVEELRIAAESGSKLKGDFLANMSHELRTPMNGVLGMNRLLLETDLNEEQRGLAQTVQNSAHALLELLNDILDFSKIEAGELNLENLSFNLHEAIEEVVDLLAVKAQEKEIELLTEYDADSPHFIIGDAGRIRQIIINLVGNAIKFTNQGHVLINVKSQISGELLTVEIEIKDTGIGIPEDKLDYIFNKFSQAEESTTRKFGGTGLGLAISKKLVEMMGGEIGVESTLGDGSIFWLDMAFPIGAASQVVKKKHIPLVEHEELKDLKILVVDDVSVNVILMRRILTKFGCSVDTAANGVEAVDMVEDITYDVVFMDCHMPEMDGFEATSEIRKREGNTDTHVHIVALTADAMQGDREKCLAGGMDDYMNKPVTPERALEILDIYLNKAES